MKVQSFETAIPVYYAWFLNETQSQQLMQMGQKFFRLCLEKFRDLLRYLKNEGTLLYSYIAVLFKEMDL